MLPKIFIYYLLIFLLPLLFTQTLAEEETNLNEGHRNEIVEKKEKKEVPKRFQVTFFFIQSKLDIIHYLNNLNFFAFSW